MFDYTSLSRSLWLMYSSFDGNLFLCTRFLHELSSFFLMNWMKGLNLKNISESYVWCQMCFFLLLFSAWQRKEDCREMERHEERSSLSACLLIISSVNIISAKAKNIKFIKCCCVVSQNGWCGREGGGKRSKVQNAITYAHTHFFDLIRRSLK